MKNLVIIGMVSLAALLGGAYYYITSFGGAKQETVEEQEQALSPEIEAVLAGKILLVEEMAADKKLIEILVAANEENKGLSKEAINKLDADWKATEGDSEFSGKFMGNGAAVILKRFQEKNPGFVEIFVTDVFGLNVGQTNKTSDYLQADEEWWTGAYAGGVGRSYHGMFEFDESSQSRSVAIYAPVYDAEKKVAGIVKAVLDMAAIQIEL